MTDSDPVHAIRLRGVRQNNLKGFDLDVPLGHLVVVTGLSGAGKSSLVFETLHAEGQRRYVETFSPYTRQFMEMMDRPKVDRIENIRPSIAIEQRNTVKTSRSTVGTMTELCDFFKVWFAHAAHLYDPETGLRIEDDNPDTIWKKVLAAHKNATILLAFSVSRTGKLKWNEILPPLSAQGYTRIIVDGNVQRIEDVDPAVLGADQTVHVIQDRIKVESRQRSRFLEGARTALHFGHGQIQVFNTDGAFLDHFSEGLHAPGSDRRFRPAAPNLFSFNSPLGACPRCRGFGRVIEIDYRLVIPDESKSIEDGAIRAFQGAVYSESQRDLIRASRRHGIPTNVPWEQMTPAQQAFVIEGEPGYSGKGWYGIRRFFDWLEGNTYKMHVRVFLSKYRAYVTCPDCKGNRLQPEALCWKWNGYTLPELYRLPVSRLLEFLESEWDTASDSDDNDRRVDLAVDAIRTRLTYLAQVGLGYLTLDRSSRSLSGGETQRVNLTSCLGTSLVDTLFILDEPSIGLHPRDIDRLIRILRSLTDLGNTVVVVEHDESIMRAADTIIEIGPEPGSRGGHVVFQGPADKIAEDAASITGKYLSGRETIAIPEQRRPVPKTHPRLRFRGVTKHNLDGLDVSLPLGRFVALSGVSGSGKSTLLDNVIHQGMLARAGKVAEDPARIREIDTPTGFSEVVLIDQSAVSRTPRSNAALFVDAWDPIRQLFAGTEEARSAGFTASDFSFNSGNGRCATCDGLGYERIEMQFMADVYVECPVCEGKRFKQEVLDIRWKDRSVDAVLKMDVAGALEFFHGQSRIVSRLKALVEVGLGYLPLGQPLNTLSGGESQRLKLVKYLSRFGDSVDHALILIDEPTTGLHRHDVARLLKVLHALVDQGHSLIVIEHHLDVLAAADWLLELGPGAGDEGGKVVFEGTPEAIRRCSTETTPFLADTLDGGHELRAAEPSKAYGSIRGKARHLNGGATTVPQALTIVGAREHNLQNLSVEIPHRQMTVVTGVSGSGKSSLAFDIVFAEGQRRFMESMSSWARQFVEQLPRPDIDQLSGIAPTVAIEQRVTRGSRKSTVATITEVAQYLRLLYARAGVPHSPVSDEPLVSLSASELKGNLDRALKNYRDQKAELVHLCAPLVRGRKGHHQPLANWATDHGYSLLRIDGSLVPLSEFKKLDRYREHDIELVVASITLPSRSERARMQVRGREGVNSLDAALAEALDRGKGACFVCAAEGSVLGWFSTRRTDPATGEAYPELDPKHFSWNSARGWCPVCRGHGSLEAWMREDERYDQLPADFDDSQTCPGCDGGRLNALSRSVYLFFKDKGRLNLPGLLSLEPARLLERLSRLKLDARGRAIANELIPEIRERLRFMDEVGLEYLSLDRATNTLSGGEAQRIRLAAQLGSNLSGVLYVLDEPSIGLHARDNDRLLDSLANLKAKGNTLLVVEHDPDTMRAADRILDLGPGAGVHGGRLLATGTVEELTRHPDSLTGRYLKSGMPHPARGAWRELPAKWNIRRKSAAREWLVLEEPGLRNLKGGRLTLPKERLSVFCGISGAGKSTMVRDLLHPLVDAAIRQNADKLLPAQAPVRDFKRLVHGNTFKAVIEVDQSPIGKTPRSTPATYIGAFDLIRQHFGSLPEAKIRGYTPSSFSFNTKGGRCETCKGAGRIKLEMSFMPDTFVQCDDCAGRRYGPDLLEIEWNGRNIADVLDMSFEEAAEFFSFDSRLQGTLQLMVETGLGYIRLGQSSPTLSGGEAQRLKLVSELARGLPSYKERSRGITASNLYLLEEPTIGLHLSDCERLVELLHRLVDQGHTVVVIEHNTDLIAEADYVVEIGPEGGSKGGKILYQGDVPGLKESTDSPTAAFLPPLDL